MSSILILGGAGYIGSHTARYFKDRGRELVVYDNLSTGFRDSVKNITFVEGDLHDTRGLERVMERHRVDAVIHFAAFSQVGESMVNPEKYYYNNLAGTLSVLRAMVNQQVQNIVFSSTAAVYGDPVRIPIVETADKKPKNIYGKTKLIIENILKDYEGPYGVRSVCLRYFNAAGAHPDATIGESHRPESHLIPLVLQAALGQRDHLDIFGDDYETPDGTCVRDYIHVMDLADAHYRALEHLQRGGASAAYNLGNGSGFSVRQVIEAARYVTGREIRAEVRPRRAGDPAILIASSDRISRELGWQPKMPELDRIIATAWEWHRTHPDGYER
ncbi:UDP-glucose 4-epimerase GalE [Gehongia tenuis]|uniref:UDP-glucose 4-epimerase n=1 Tax=Gehongia tenuis TaxID=2763655 RepID=A0A926D4C9_9FIRM|nr:UDP-glucose 4-epimerase GalE [Gehongia tenuis]MBC8531026.1 UDP-glucose 4-epimerase GalE [Gehongia tenuis]